MLETHRTPARIAGATRRDAPRAASLVELLVVFALAGLIAAIAFPRVAVQLDRLGVRGATDDILRGMAMARTLAATRADYASVIVDAARGQIRVRCGGLVPWERNLALRYGVRVTTSRDSITFTPTGIGWGAANTTIVVTRGGSADTIVTSRLGRVRRS